MAAQPQGQVTLLFSDIEGSTRLLQELGRDRYTDGGGFWTYYLLTSR